MENIINIVNCLVGSAITIVVAFFTYKITEKDNLKREARNNLINFILNNKVLMSSCLNVHLSIDINYDDLRKELNTNIHTVFLLSKEYKILILSIYEHVNLKGNSFKENEMNLINSLDELYVKLKEGDINIGDIK